MNKARIYQTINHKYPGIFMVSMLLSIVMIQFSCKKVIPAQKSNSTIKYFNGGPKDKVTKIFPTSDGGFVYCGISRIDSAREDAFLLKVDGQGNEQWYRSYGGANNDEFLSVIQTSDGGYLAVGKTNSFGKGSTDGSHQMYDYIVKTNAEGMEEWTKSYYLEPGEANSVIESSDHNYFLTGYVASTSAGVNGISLLKLDGAGQKLLYKIFTSLPSYPPKKITAYYHSFGRSIQMANDGSVLICGEMSKSSYITNGVANMLYFLMKLNANNGTVSYLQPYYNTARGDNFYDIKARMKIVNLNDGYFIGTYTVNQANSRPQMELIKTDFDGNLLWDKQYSGLAETYLTNIIPNTDGSYTLIGSTSNYYRNYSFPQNYYNLKTVLTNVNDQGVVNWQNLIGSENNAITTLTLQPANTGWQLGGYSTMTEGIYDKTFWLSVNNKGEIIK